MLISKVIPRATTIIQVHQLDSASQEPHHDGDAHVGTAGSDFHKQMSVRLSRFPWPNTQCEKKILNPAPCTWEQQQKDLQSHFEKEMVKERVKVADAVMAKAQEAIDIGLTHTCRFHQFINITSTILEERVSLVEGFQKQQQEQAVHLSAEYQSKLQEVMTTEMIE